MKPTNDLHELIFSLTPNEKGYFKKQCQKTGGNSQKYLRLFDAVAAQKNYDEKALKKKLADPILIRNLSSEKNYLFHLILETVIAGNFSQDPVLEMKMLLSKARWLAAHSFSEQSMRFVKKVSDWSSEHELFTLQLDALDLEWLLWQYLNNEERRTIEEIAADRLAALNKMIITDQLRAFDIKVIRLFQETGIGRKESHLEKYRALYDESQAIAKNNGGLSLRAKTYLLNIAVFYSNVTGDSQKSMELLEELILLLDRDKILKRERLSFYLSSLNNLILTQLHLGKYTEARKMIAWLENTVPETQPQRNTVFITRYNTGFDLYNYTKDFDSGYALSQKLKTDLPEFEDKLDNRYTGHIRFAAFRACFYSGHLKEALQWINQIVQKPDGESFKPELVTIARIAELTIHETLENYDLLEKLTESAGRFLSKTNNLYQFEKLMLGFFHEQVKAHPDKKALLKLQNGLQAIEKNMLEERVFFYFDFRAWVEARIKNRDISTVLKEN